MVEYSHLGYDTQGFPILPILGKNASYPDNGKNINWEIVNGLREYFFYYRDQNEMGKVHGYLNLVSTILKFNERIVDIEQLDGVKGIGP